MLQNLATRRPRALRGPVAWALLFVSLLALALYAGRSGPAGWEVALTQDLQRWSPSEGRGLAHAITGAGDYPWAVLLPGIAIVGLAVTGHRGLALFLAVAVIARSLSPVLKDLIDRDRPSPAVVDVARTLDSQSFPSGHALGAMLFYGFLAYAVGLAFDDRRWRIVLQAACVVMIALMGYSRVELGEHWPTDVIGGYAVGALIIMPLIAVHQRWRARDAATVLARR